MFGVLTRRLDETARGLVARASYFLFSQVLGAGLTFALYLMAARQLGAAEAGLFFLSVVIAGILSVFAVFGTDSAVLRRAAVSASQRSWDEVAALRRRAVRLVLGVSLALTVVFFAAAPLAARGLFDEPGLTLPLRLMVLSIAPQAILSIHANLLKAVERTALAGLLQNLAIPAGTLTAFLAIVALGGPPRAATLALAHAASVVLAATAAVWCWTRVVPRHGAGGVAKPSGLLAESLPLLWVASVQLIFLSADQFMIGMLRASADVGIYGAAARVAQFGAVFASLALATAAAPRIAALHAAGDTAGLQNVVQSTARLTAGLTLPVLGVIALWPEVVLGLFGEAFRAGSTALILICTAKAISALCGPVATLLIMAGRRMEVSVVLTVAAILNIVLNYLLIPRFGLMGAALATLCAVAAVNLVLAAVIRYSMGITTFAFIGRRQVPAPRRSVS